MDSRPIASHVAAGALDIGYEAADPAHREPVRLAREPLPANFSGRVDPEDAYRWLFHLFAALAAIVTLGMCAAFVIENWHALELLINT
jgi:hypothetical protein